MELPQLRVSQRVGVYVSGRGELDTRLLRAAMVARGISVVRPVMSRSGELQWLPDLMKRSHDRGGRLCCTRAGHRAVSGTTAVEIVLVPALAVDTCGRRLGYRHDGYDEILRQVGPTSLVLAAVYDDEVTDAAVEPVPEEPHGVRVDAAVTPSRVLYLARCPTPGDRRGETIPLREAR
jgi:5-formyltetrahydrofolate cyclo-ligase